MTGTTKRKTTRRTRKPKAPVFTPIEQPAGARPILSPENQVVFHNLLTSLEPTELSGATKVLDAIASNPLLMEGYKKVFRFWRIYRRENQPPSEVTFS
jgi:hypothetical protein